MAVGTLHYSDINGNRRANLDRDSISIGRSHDQDVVLSDACVSRKHALILREGETYTIVDQNSTHGTFLNSVRIGRARLRSGDVLQIGSLSGQRLRFQAQEMDETANGLPSSLPDLISSLHELEARSDKVRPAAREMEKLNWLIRAAHQLSEGATREAVLGAFLHLTLQLTGLERGFVFVLEKDQLRFAHGLNAAGEALKEDLTLSRRAIQEAVRSESKFLISDTMADKAALEWSSIIVNRIRSIYCIPLRRHASAGDSSKLLGLLYLDGQMRLGDLAEVDHELLDTVSREAAALLHNALLAEAESKARRAREELAVAAKIHSGMMSIALPKVPYAVLQARSVPCLEIGGDFYDAVAVEDGVCAVIADVSGKGVSAAIVAATLQGIIHAQLLAGQSLVEVASAVNQFLCTRNVGKYATMILLKLFPDGRVEYINCGHIQPLSILGSDIRRLEENNLVVGLIPGASYASAHCSLQTGERLLLVTDGITEAENETGIQFDETELYSVAAHNDIGLILDRVAKFHAPREAQDDCTLVGIQYTGAVDCGGQPS